MLSLCSIFYLFHDVCFAASLLVLKCIQRVIQVLSKKVCKFLCSPSLLLG